MNELQIIKEHMIIRETIGYDAIKDVKLHDLPQVIKFLQIVWNYQKMCKIDRS